MYPETPTCWPTSTDPHTRNGLTTAEQEWVEGALREERASINAAHGTFNPFRALVAPRILALSLSIFVWWLRARNSLFPAPLQRRQACRSSVHSRGAGDRPPTRFAAVRVRLIGEHRTSGEKKYYLANLPGASTR